MANYTAQEEKELNQQLAQWQKRQLTAVKGKNGDNAFERMSEIDRAVWEQVAKAESHKDVNYLVWNHAERIIDKYCKMAR